MSVLINYLIKLFKAGKKHNKHIQQDYNYVNKQINLGKK